VILSGRVCLSWCADNSGNRVVNLGPLPRCLPAEGVRTSASNLVNDDQPQRSRPDGAGAASAEAAAAEDGIALAVGGPGEGFGAALPQLRVSPTSLQPRCPGCFVVYCSACSTLPACSKCLRTHGRNLRPCLGCCCGMVYVFCSRKDLNMRAVEGNLSDCCSRH
jgi:hypothetical protein